MTPILIVVVVTLILFIVIVTAMMVKYGGNQRLRCPHCDLDFTADLLIIFDSALLTCPFCRRWILVKKQRNHYVTKRLFV